MSDSSPDAAATLTQQAYAELAEGRFEDAISTFSSSLSLAPNDAKTLRGRGLASLQLRRWSSATADFKAARALCPDDPDHWIELGVSLASDNQVYAALEVFETLLTKQPTCVRGHLQLGLLHVQLGAIPKARESLQQALACRPTLAQRQLIESILREQNTLDRKRYYRPDFAALHRQQGTTRWVQRVRELIARWRRKVDRGMRRGDIEGNAVGFREHGH